MLCDPSNPRGSGVVDVWRESVPVRFGSIDKSDKLTLDAVFNYFQEAAISHAENIGVGRDDMTANKQAWILSRITVLVNRRPDYCENVTVSTWPRGSEKLFVIRNYQINDKDDIPVVSARSAWLVLDIDKRRPLRPQSIAVPIPLNEGRETLKPEDKGAAGLEERANLQKTAERKALYTDLDANGHVNHIRYIQWMQDTLAPGLLESAVKIRLDINYLNEVLSGETVDLMSACIEDENCANTYAFEGVKNESSGETRQAAFRAELRLWM
jgi:acyl-ACP thioesterase